MLWRVVCSIRFRDFCGYCMREYQYICTMIKSVQHIKNLQFSVCIKVIQWLHFEYNTYGHWLHNKCGFDGRGNNNVINSVAMKYVNRQTNWYFVTPHTCTYHSKSVCTENTKLNREKLDNLVVENKFSPPEI